MKYLGLFLHYNCLYILFSLEKIFPYYKNLDAYYLKNKQMLYLV
ncbi:hypothetical protein EV144_102778 [Flavobacterium sp. 270]|nr:hypothetical protein EV144_102778 [Flavobacterium sp. 270]